MHFITKFFRKDVKEEESESTDFDKIPIDILIKIFSLLPSNNIPRLFLVSRKFNRAIRKGLSTKRLVHPGLSYKYINKAVAKSKCWNCLRSNWETMACWSGSCIGGIGVGALIAACFIHCCCICPVWWCPRRNAPCCHRDGWTNVCLSALRNNMAISGGSLLACGGLTFSIYFCWNKFNSCCEERISYWTSRADYNNKPELVIME